MKILKRPGKKLICILAAVCVVVAAGITALVLYLNREVAPWETVSWSTTRAEVLERFGEPDYSAREDGGVNYDKYKSFECWGISGTIIYDYMNSNTDSKICSVRWGWKLPDDSGLKNEQLGRIQDYLGKKFGNPQKYTDDEMLHSDTWYDSDGKEIKLTILDIPNNSSADIVYYFYNYDD